MGLLSRWFKKIKDEQLERQAEKQTAAVTVSPAAAAEPPKTALASAPTESVASASARPATALAYRVVIRPLVTEKAAVSESRSRYTFVVARWATKPQVRAAIQELYGVAPERVNVVNIQGKRVRFGRVPGHRSDYKKAVVTLPAGQSITIHEGV